jgi:hypothetical protein
MAKPKTSEERQLLLLQGKELTLRSNRAKLENDHLAVKEAIASAKAKLAKGRKA